MIDAERSLETIAFLHAEIMRQRAEGLREAAQASHVRLAEREKAIADLRAQIALLKTSFKPEPVETAPIMVPEKEADLDSARFTTVSLPRTMDWTALAPYAAIAAYVVFIELGGARRPAFVTPTLTALLQPASAAVTNARPSAKDAPVVDEDLSQEALLLVHEWKLPGDEKPLGERLGGELALPGARSAWNVERTGSHDYRVTFQPSEKSLPYSFEADVEARVVWPTPETQELLAPRFTAALRGSAR